LSYTQFEYSNLVVEPEESPGEDITVRFDVTTPAHLDEALCQLLGE
jgi:hypothetical protein